MTDASILVVDDSDADRALMADALEAEGYRVTVASGGLEGVKTFQSLRPDCVLLDVCMQDLDGFAACSRIRTLERGTRVPILFLTGMRDVDTFDRAMEAGGDDFLTKPIQLPELLVRVRTAVKLGWADAELREQYEPLKHQRDDLLRLQLQKERLMAFVVHDLKNPVSAIDLQAQFLLREGALSPSAADSASQIRTEVRQLARMISNLLDIAKAEEGRLSMRPGEIDLRALVADVLA